MSCENPKDKTKNVRTRSTQHSIKLSSAAGVNCHKSKMMLPLSFLITSVIFPISVLSQDTIGCYINGECKDSLYADVGSFDHDYDCHQFCIDTTGCHFFNFYTNDRLCFAYVNCVAFEPSGVAIAGDSTCAIKGPTCFVTGRCDGTLVEFQGQIFSPEECLSECQQTPNCTWWTFDSDDGFCFMNSNCVKLDETCESCTSGEVSCGKTKAFYGLATIFGVSHLF